MNTKLIIGFTPDQTTEILEKLDHLRKIKEKGEPKITISAFYQVQNKGTLVQLNFSMERIKKNES